MINRSFFAPSFFICAMMGACLIPGFPSLAQQLQPTPADASAQQQQQPPADTSAQQPSQPEQKSKENKGQKSQEQQTGTSSDRIFWTLPNFLTVENASHIPPLTSSQKFKLVARNSFDPAEYPFIGFLAGIGQARNSDPGYGQEAGGYGKRYAASFADNTIENFTTGAIFPSLLRQDPRYYRLGTGGFWRRSAYCVSRIFVTRTDSGQKQFNYSEIIGSAVAGGISNAYHPAGDRTVTNTISVWWTQVGWDVVATVLKEFWPDIRHKVRNHKQ